MLTFWLLAIILFAIAIAFVLYPYLKVFINPITQDKQVGIDQKQINIDIAKEQLDSLENNFAVGEISQEEYDSLKYELEATLIDDIAESEQVATTTVDKNSSSHKFFIVFVLVFIPLCSLIFYQKLGSPAFIDGSAQQITTQQTKDHSQVASANKKQPSVKEMIGMLINKLKENPNDKKGWFLLARTYMAIEQYQQAYKVYEKLLSLTGEDAAILVSMADALAMTKNGRISGEPEKLVLRSLQVAPNNITGLWLAGIAQKEQGNNQQALSYWNKLYPLLKGDLESQQSVKKMILSVAGTVPESENSDALTAQIINATQTVANNNKVIEVTISLSAQMLGQADKNDMIFIYAKALQGPPMPLAAVKKKVSDLPLTITLDDSMAMMPQMKISAFEQVKVGARISKSGRPIKQVGDLMSAEVVVDLNNIQGVNLIINQMVKP